MKNGKTNSGHYRSLLSCAKPLTSLMPSDSTSSTGDRLQRQLAFLIEADKVKTILRRNRVIAEPARRENDAEHMYHFALMAMILAEHSNTPVDPFRVLQMILIHDLVEIDAGDAFVYDAQAQIGKREREERAADRIFGLLPPDQTREMRALWEEFEAEETPEAQFAASLDRLQPMLSNYHTQGGAWKQYGVDYSRVVARNSKIAHGSSVLWEHARGLLDEALAKGDIPAADAPQTGSESTS